MSRIISISTVALSLAVSAASVAAQTPEEHLITATQLLNSISVSPQSDVGKQITVLKDDFTDMAGTYLLRRPAAQANATGAPGTVGTSGSSSPDGDWRAKYRTVEKDFAAIIGSTGPASTPAATDSLDPSIRKQLEDVRSHMQLFYASTMSQPDGNPIAHTGSPAALKTRASSTAASSVAPTAEAPQTAPAAPPDAQANPPAVSGEPSMKTPAAGNTAAPADADLSTAVALLDRIQRILDDATKDQLGKVSLDRGAIDEMRAEVDQIRTALKRKR